MPPIVGFDGDPQRVTLHAEMIDILSEAGRDGLSCQAVADLVNARGVYRKRDGSLVEASQVRLRAKNYTMLFELAAGRVHLRSLIA
jgi:hypothetical protein